MHWKIDMHVYTTLVCVRPGPHGAWISGVCFSSQSSLDMPMSKFKMQKYRSLQFLSHWQNSKWGSVLIFIYLLLLGFSYIIQSQFFNFGDYILGRLLLQKWKQRRTKHDILLLPYWVNNLFPIEYNVVNQNVLQHHKGTGISQAYAYCLSSIALWIMHWT